MSDDYFSLKDGLPTGPDVELLLRAWPELKPGDRIPYDEIAVWIGAPWGATRFRTVTNAWRRRLHDDRNLVLGVEARVGFYVKSAEEIVHTDTYGTLVGIGRKSRKQRRALATVRTQNTTLQGGVLHGMRLLRAIEDDVRRHRSSLVQLPDTSVKPAPRLQPPTT